MTYANQKLVIVDKEETKMTNGNSRPFLLAYVDTIEKAGKELKGNAFKAYMYLLTNINGYKAGISPQDLANRYGISEDSARDAIKTLIDKHYLVLLDGTKETYKFYDNTKRIPIELPEEAKAKLETKRIKINNEIKEMTFDEFVNLIGDTEQAKNLWEGNN